MHAAPKLEQQLLNEVPFKVKKFVQERDKEMFNVQRAFLLIKFHWPTL
jgi:hypothetical protein